MPHLPFTGEPLKDPESRFAMRLHSNVCNGLLAGILIGAQLDLSPFHQMWNLGELVAKVWLLLAMLRLFLFGSSGFLVVISSLEIWQADVFLVLNPLHHHLGFSRGDCPGPGPSLATRTTAFQTRWSGGGGLLLANLSRTLAKVYENSKPEKFVIPRGSASPLNSIFNRLSW